MKEPVPEKRNRARARVRARSRNNTKTQTVFTPQVYEQLQRPDGLVRVFSQNSISKRGRLFLYMCSGVSEVHRIAIDIM